MQSIFAGPDNITWSRIGLPCPVYSKCGQHVMAHQHENFTLQIPLALSKRKLQQVSRNHNLLDEVIMLVSMKIFIITAQVPTLCQVSLLIFPYSFGGAIRWRARSKMCQLEISQMTSPSAKYHLCISVGHKMGQMLD